MAIDAMKAGIPAAFEVGPANSVDECWELVKTYEETGVPSMLLENGCFARDSMMVLNMVRQGLFGELVHCRCGYLHDLQGRLVLGKGTGPNPLSSSDEPVKGEGDYRSMHNQFRNGDLYPTHGVGPIAKCLQINRGNRFSYLTSTATKSRGLEDWAEENLPEDHPRREVDWKRGDIVTTTIKCQNGETVVITFDTALPRPRGESVRRVHGVDGIWEHEKDAVYIEDRSPEHEWESVDKYRDEFEHPLWNRYRQDDQMPKRGHGGRDSLELRVFVESVRHGSPPPIDVYDAAAWRAIAPLSEASIAKGSQPVEFPDFTNGQWMSNDPIFGSDGEYV
jgi:predicted dehydrogenase